MRIKFKGLGDLIQVLLLMSQIFADSAASQVHEHMTNQEIQKIFRVRRSQVPAHEVVSVHYASQRNNENAPHRIKIKSESRNIDLYLQPNEGMLVSDQTPVWLVKPDGNSPDKLVYQKLPTNVLENIGKAYHDYETNSAVILTKMPNGKIQMTGRILNNFVVHPLPHRLQVNDTTNDQDKLNETDGEFMETHQHIIYQHLDINNNDIHEGIRTKSRNNHSNSSSQQRIINKRATLIESNFPDSTIPYPEIIYPEILTVMDNLLFQTLGNSVEDSLLYLLSFWNAVDLRYRSLANPKIRLHITCIIISTKKGGIPFLDKNRLYDTLVDADLALQDMSHHFFHEGVYTKRFPFEIYDFAVALTKLDMCNMENGMCDPGTLGYAYEWGACNRSYIDRNTEAVGIVEDNGGYSGLIPATHEVAHLMGATHDRNDEICSPPEGYIMNEAYRIFGTNNFQWSNCSIEQFQEFFQANDSECLFVTSITNQGNSLPRILPGTLQSLDDQCQKVCKGRAYIVDQTVCTQLKCFDRYGFACRTLAAAAEGSFCGDGKRCLSGYCLSVNETFIPNGPTTTKPSSPLAWGGISRLLINTSYYHSNNSIY